MRIECWGRYLGLTRKVTGEWGRLYYEGLNGLYSSPNNIRVLKSRRMRWAGHVARVRDRRGAYRVLVERPEGRNHLEELGVEGGNC
jgi:hypothetical protein